MIPPAKQTRLLACTARWEDLMSGRGCGAQQAGAAQGSLAAADAAQSAQEPLAVSVVPHEHMRLLFMCVCLALMGAGGCGGGCCLTGLARPAVTCTVGRSAEAYRRRRSTESRRSRSRGENPPPLCPRTIV